MNEPEIKILRIIRLPGDRTLKAYVDIELNGLIVCGWRVIEKEGKPLEIQYPTTTYIGKDGQRKYRALISASGQLLQAISSCIVLAWSEEAKRGTGTSSNASDN
jgi:hypothetical protein